MNFSSGGKICSSYGKIGDFEIKSRSKLSKINTRKSRTDEKRNHHANGSQFSEGNLGSSEFAIKKGILLMGCRIVNSHHRCNEVKKIVDAGADTTVISLSIWEKLEGPTLD